MDHLVSRSNTLAEHLTLPFPHRQEAQDRAKYAGRAAAARSR
jgi:hypothetical protein